MRTDGLQIDSHTDGAYAVSLSAVARIRGRPYDQYSPLLDVDLSTVGCSTTSRTANRGAVFSADRRGTSSAATWADH
jgi:hypothetical protein